MRTLLPLALFGVLGFAGPADAQTRRFPYDAVVEVEDVYVRSGPGRRYYTTSRLKAGDRVTVHRHDPGGWYMIAPPRGSFSWIRAEYVEQRGNGLGVLAENDVVVRVGSSFGDVREVEQRRLSTGDRVRILDEKTFRDERGDVRYFKIAPPTGEYRWIAGSDVTPIDPAARRDRQRDPYARPPGIPPENRERRPDPFAVPEEPRAEPRGPIAAGDGFGERPITRRRSDAVAPTGPDPSSTSRFKRELRAVDVRFRAMIDTEPPNWDVEGLQRDYESLQRIASTPATAGQLQIRLDAVSRYAGIKRDYLEFLALAETTSARDAELVSLQNGGGPVAEPATVTDPVPQPQPAPVSPTPVQPTPVEPTPVRGTTPVTASRPQLSGAGIVQRAAVTFAGAPSHVLVAPGGRILAYLTSANPTINLDAFNGRPMGITGRRGYDTDLQADLIQVRGLIPVRLSR